VLIGLALLACVASVPLAGGRLSALAGVHFRGVPWLLAGLGLQVLVIEIVPAGGGDWHAAAHLASYGLVAAFVACNHGVPYLWTIALGGALNLVAIAANGGVMPAHPEALAGAGLDASGDAFVNSTAVAGARLQVLGDVLWIPAGWPAANVFSIGDVLLVAGAFLALHTIGGSRLSVPRFAALRRPAAARG